MADTECWGRLENARESRKSSVNSGLLHRLSIEEAAHRSKSTEPKRDFAASSCSENPGGVFRPIQAARLSLSLKSASPSIPRAPLLTAARN
ncbi:hypothetical protein [Burkholderia metallica]|uniref:hypothetical protein n=1 Tax=Burkholderia metallica TaxID=488729 RepID=UPI0015829B30|nr:hypothetical protein [Burkholderia metallica]